jgi:hypothetical protein
MLGPKTLAPALLALLIGGCPKRQTTPRIVYVQPPPSISPGSNTAAQSSPEAIIIQEPAPPALAEPAPPVAATVPPPQAQSDKLNKRRPPVRESEETGATVQPPEVTEPPLQLQPSGNDVGEAELNRLLEQMAVDLADLERRTNLSQDQQRAIEDAGTFRKQSLKALQQHDLLRAKQLADKAELLIKAVQELP